MKNHFPKTLRKRPNRLYQIRPRGEGWEIFRDASSQGISADRDAALARALRHAKADAQLGMKVQVETIAPDGSRKIDWQEN